LTNEKSSLHLTYKQLCKCSKCTN